MMELMENIVCGKTYPGASRPKRQQPSRQPRRLWKNSPEWESNQLSSDKCRFSCAHRQHIEGRKKWLINEPVVSEEPTSKLASWRKDRAKGSEHDMSNHHTSHPTDTTSVLRRGRRWLQQRQSVRLFMKTSDYLSLFIPSMSIV